MLRPLIILAASYSLVAAVDSPTATLADATRVYLANDDHTDFMWTADDDTYHRVFVEMLDFHLALAEQTASNPSPYRNRFNADGSYWLHAYEQQKTPAEFARLIAAVKSGTISVPLNSLVACYGGQPVEAILRGMYYAGRIERRHGLRFDLAVAMENQTLPLGLASLFAGAGAKYTWRGVCACASKLTNQALAERPHEVYWSTGLDGQRLLMKWYSLGGKRSDRIGSYLEADDPTTVLAFIDSDAEFKRRQTDPVTKEPYRVIGLFGFGGDDLARKTGVTPPPTIPGVPGLHKLISMPACEHFHVIAQRHSDARRQVIVSNEVDFFADFERTHGATLPSVALTYGNEWDLYSASMSETSARAKRAVEKLRTADLLGVLVSLKYPTFLDRHQAARDRAYHDIGLYWEHNWTGDGPISRAQRAAWQEKLATGIEYHVTSVLGEGLVRLGGMIPRPEQANRFFVLNPLGWARSEAADFRYQGASDIHVHDLTSGQDVPHQFVRVRGARHLRILASDVPAAGYKVFEIRPGRGTAVTDQAATTAADGSTIENSRVRLRIARDGAISSLIDRARGERELAANIGDLRLNDLAPRSDDGDALAIVDAGPVSVTIRARSAAGLDHTTAITLYRDSARIDLHNEITANFSDVRHWSFSTSFAQPLVHTEEVGAIIRAKTQAAGGHYADRLARYDYLTVNHVADLGDGANTHGLIISNPDLAFAKLGTSTPDRLDLDTPQLNFLAGGQVDGRRLGIPDQHGHDRFIQRFALHPRGAYDQVAAMRFALEHQNPLVAGAVISTQEQMSAAVNGGTPYPETSYSLVQVDHPGVALWALKVADEGISHGIVARVWNLTDATAEGSLSLTTGITAAQRTTHLETNLEELRLNPGGTVTTRFAPQQLQTYRLLTPPNHR